ncbi:Cytochrome c oxidase subunit 6A, mitochondrial [Myotisia sp. PD_48]|nr:Cytochrome c oxidase subunit 6A, mitochondrial [Myotisia sp. PD_48]
MLPRQSILRATQRASARPLRSVVQRRSNSTLPDNSFNRERAAVKAHAASTADLWRKLSIYAVIPCLILGGINAYNLWTEHWEHWEHMPPLEERTEYPYQNLRTKNYFWGDGDKTAFWNESVNYHKKDKVV